MEMKKYKLGEIATVEISGVDKKTKDNEIPVRLCNFTDVYHNWAITKEMTDSFMQASANQKEIDSFSLKKGQVAFTKDSETRDDIGIPTYIADDFENVVLGYHTALITPDKSKLSGKYLNAFMNTRYIQKYFENNASGSGQRYTLSNETLNAIPVIAPDLQAQEKIGDVFSNIDKKIALNCRMNAKLEQMAKRLYDHWFVQFDFPNADGKPYKASGGKMVWNETLKREIPQGWEVGKIGDFVEIITKGTTPSTAGFEFEQIGINFVKVECIENGKILTENLMHISEEANRALKRSQLQENDILVSIAGRLGSSAVVSKNVLPANTNQAVGIIRLRNDFKFLAYYLYERIVSDDVQRHLQGANAQSIQKNLTLPNLAEIIFPYDKDFRVLSDFTTKTLSIFNYQLSIEKETAKLTALRDRLLPLLMNGQVEVR